MWDDRYATEGDVFGRAPNQFVAEVLAEASPGEVLDLGCGQGRNAIWLASRGHRVTAVDFSEVGVEHAAGHAAEAGVEVEFVAADLMHWEPKPEAYDIVLLSYLQLEPARRIPVHQKAIAALAPGGTLLLVAHHRENLTDGVGGPRLPEVCFTEAELAEDFGELEILRNEMVMRQVDRATISGTALDIILVARKSA